MYLERFVVDEKEKHAGFARFLAERNETILYLGGFLIEKQKHMGRQVVEAAEAFDADESLAAQAQAHAEQCEQALDRAETARSDKQGREAEARAQRSRAEGENTALEAEVTALAKLLARGSQESVHLLDRLQVEQGFEKALGAALADDLRAAEVEGEDALSGWRFLPDYPVAQPLPNGITPLSNHVSTPDALGRRMTQIGLVDGDEGVRLQAAMQHGQRFVSLEIDPLCLQPRDDFDAQLKLYDNQPY